MLYAYCNLRTKPKYSKSDEVRSRDLGDYQPNGNQSVRTLTGFVEMAQSTLEHNADCCVAG